MELNRGTFRAIGNNVDIVPANLEDKGLRIIFDGDFISSIHEIDSYTSEMEKEIESIRNSKGWQSTQIISSLL